MIVSSLFVWGVINEGAVESVSVALVFVQNCPVPYKIAERIVHGRPESESRHQPGCRVWGHEGQTSAVGSVCQAKRVQAEMSTKRIGAGVGSKVRSVRLQRREG